MQKNFSIVWDASARQINPEKDLPNGKSEIDYIKDIIKKSNNLCNKTIIFKLPSVIINNDSLLENFIDNISLIHRCGAKIFIVHDNINLVDKVFKSFGFDNRFDKEIVEDSVNAQITEMVVSGYINKLIVSKLSNLGIDAVGISGKDGRLMQASSKIYDATSNNLSKPIISNIEILCNFQDNNIVGVISPIAADHNGRTKLLDPNLTISSISSFIDVNNIVYLCEDNIFKILNGVHYSISSLKELLPNINNQNAKNLINSSISALENGIENVHFLEATKINSMLLTMFKA